MKKSSFTMSKAPGARTADLRCWLAMHGKRGVDSGAPITAFRVQRTSSRSIEQFKQHWTTNLIAAERQLDADVKRAEKIGWDVLRRDAVGDATRADLGDDVFVIQMWHVPGGVGRAQLGVLLRVGQTMFLYLLSSARAGNLTDDHEERRGNAATEVLSEVVRSLFAAGRGAESTFRLLLYAREHARIVRDELHGAGLKSTLVKCEVIVFAPNRMDLTRQSDAQHFTFGTLMSASAVHGLIEGMNRAEIALQANGAFNGSIRLVPFTHRAAEVITQIGERQHVEVNKHRLVAVDGEQLDEARALLRSLVDAILLPNDQLTGIAAADWSSVGALMAAAGLPSRMPADSKKGVLLREKPESSWKGAALTLFSKKWIGAWRTGVLLNAVPEKAGALNLDLGEDVQVTEKDGVRVYLCPVEMPLPEGGWGISEQEWEQVLSRRYPGRSRAPRIHTGLGFPLVGLPEWSDGHGSLLRLISRSRYVLEQCEQAQAVDADGEDRGWMSRRKERVATLRPAELHQDIARAMREALGSLGREQAPLKLASRSAGQLEGPALFAAVELELQKAVKAARHGVAAAEEFLVERRAQLLSGETDPDAVTRARDGLAAREACRSLALAALSDHQAGRARCEAEPAVRDADVEPITAEFVAASLEKCTDVAPPWLQQACAALLVDVRLTPQPRAGAQATVSWSAELHLPLVGEQDAAVVPLSGSVRDRQNATKGRAAFNGPEGWAWQFFYLGRSLEQIGEICGIDGASKKNSYLYKGLSAWLEGGEVHKELRAALLDCPVLATRRVIWSLVTGDVQALQGIDEGFADHVRACYRARPLTTHWGWCGDTHQLARRASALLSESGGSLPLHDLVARLEVSKDAVLALARENGKRHKNGAAATVAKIAVSPLLKTFHRGTPGMLPQDRRLMLRPCPHRDCPAALAGGLAYASVAIRVPETEWAHGVLCPSCRRLPDLRFAAARFPADYLRPWSGRFGQGSHAGARQHHGSFLDTTFPDAGPSVTLPDTGSQPRPETRLSAPISSRKDGGAGPRVLFCGVAVRDLPALEERLAALGGSQALKLTPSVRCVVFADPCVGGAAAKLSRARLLGIECLTVQQFHSRAGARLLPGD